MKNNKKIIFILITISFIIFFSFKSTFISLSVKNSLITCSNTVIPSLFPFFVLSNLLTDLLSSTTINPSIFAYLCSLISGFPSGTKTVCTIYEKGKISKNQAEALFLCTCNASPAYLIAYIGICIFKSYSVGLTMLLSQVICSMVCALKFAANSNRKEYSVNEIDILDSICKAMANSISACINVCGYITFTGIIADILIESDILGNILKIFSPKLQDIIEILIVGSIEISHGLKLIPQKASYGIVLASILIGFSGISIVFQCINCAKNVNLNPINIIKGKMFYASLMPLITSIFLKIFSEIKILLIVLITTIFILIILCFYIIFDKRITIRYNKEKKKW